MTITLTVPKSSQYEISLPEGVFKQVTASMLGLNGNCNRFKYFSKFSVKLLWAKFHFFKGECLTTKYMQSLFGRFNIPVRDLPNNSDDFCTEVNDFDFFFVRLF